VLSDKKKVRDKIKKITVEEKLRKLVITDKINSYPARIISCDKKDYKRNGK
jgi:hypothetical protein